MRIDFFSFASIQLRFALRTNRPKFDASKPLSSIKCCAVCVGGIQFDRIFILVRFRVNRHVHTGILTRRQPRVYLAAISMHQIDRNCSMLFVLTANLFSIMASFKPNDSHSEFMEQYFSAFCVNFYLLSIDLFLSLFSPSFFFGLLYKLFTTSFELMYILWPKEISSELMSNSQSENLLLCVERDFSPFFFLARLQLPPAFHPLRKNNMFTLHGSMELITIFKINVNRKRCASHFHQCCFECCNSYWSRSTSHFLHDTKKMLYF